MNTFEDTITTLSSTDNTTYWPVLVSSFSGYDPKARMTYEYDPITTDNPDQLHSAIGLSINYNPFNGGSDDGSGVYIYSHLEKSYQGVALANITSIVTSAGIGTFTVDSTAALYKGMGFAIRDNSVTANNTYWKVAGITNSTTFTSIFSDGTAPTGTGTGGDIRGECNEENHTSNGYRYIAITSNNGNQQDGIIGLTYHTVISLPDDHPCSGGDSQAAFFIQGSESSTSNAKQLWMGIRNKDAFNKNSAIYLRNDASGKNDFQIAMAPALDTADDVAILQGGLTAMFLKGARTLIGNVNASSDDGTNKLQVFGSQKISTDLSVAGKYKGAGGQTLQSTSGTDTRWTFVTSTNVALGDIGYPTSLRAGVYFAASNTSNQFEFLLTGKVNWSVNYDRLTCNTAGTKNLILQTTSLSTADRTQTFPDASGTFALLTTAPSTATNTGIAGQIAYDSSYFYVCTATNTWVRAALSTW